MLDLIRRHSLFADGDGDDGGGGGGGGGGDDGGGGGGDDGGGGEKHWSATLGGELANHPGLQKFADPTAAAKGYLEMEKALSAQGVRVPGEGAGEDEITRYRNAIGVPEKPEEYGFEENVTIPEGLEWNTEYQEQMLKIMHEEGLTPQQVHRISQASVDFEASVAKTTQEAKTTNRAEAEKLLRQKWGSSYDAHIRGANLAMQEIFGDNMKEMATTQLADGTMLGVNPAFVMAMAKLGETFAEHNVSGIGDRRRYTKTPDEAAAEIEKLKGDQAFQEALWNPDNPGHAAAVQRRNDLYAMRAAGGAS